MSTRGIYGFRINETDKLAYNHADSFPDALGVKILSELQSISEWNTVEERIRSLSPIHESRMIGVNDDIFRTELRRHYPNLHYRGNPKNYYDLMSPLQGTLEPYLSGKLSFMATANEFIDNSLFCQWGYVADLDKHQFEIYRGGQITQPPTDAQYQDGPDRMGYYPCRMVQAYRLDQLPTPRKFLGDMTTWK